jgi:NADH-quinone oxidoreductase subunit M
LLLVAGFASKVPLVPFHNWLPLAHVEAPTAGSVVLAGVLLKVGAYGFLRLCIPLAPDASLSLGLPLVTLAAAIGIVYGAWCAYSQNDVKRLIAYSSVSHLGMCMIGMFSLTAAGLAGSLMQMLNHGLSTAALFLLIGVIYERYHTRKLSDYGGMAKRLPYFGFFMVFIALSSVGLPGLNGFVGEALCLMGIMQQETHYGNGPVLTFIAASGMIFGAWYLMTMLRRLLFGAVQEPEHHGPPITDLKVREWIMLAPIAILCVVLGVYPQPVLTSAQPDLDKMVNISDGARERAKRAAIQPATAQSPHATARH